MQKFSEESAISKSCSSHTNVFPQSEVFHLMPSPENSQNIPVNME